MTLEEIIRKYGVTKEIAEMVLELMKESDEMDDTFVPIAVNTALTTSRLYQEIIGEEPTLEDIETIYNRLPESLRKPYGNKYLLGCIEFLMNGKII